MSVPNHTLPTAQAKKNLKTAVFFTSSILLLEFTGSLWTGSIGLLSDAGHVLMDLMALTLAFGAAILSDRPTSGTRTFGLHRMEIFAALFNGFILAAIAVIIFITGIKRVMSPKPILAPQMLIIASIGLAINLIVAVRLYPHSKGDVNVRGAFLHAFSDAISSFAVITGGIVVWASQWWRADSIASLIVSLIIGYGAARLLHEAIHTLLEGVPFNINLSQVEQNIKNVPGVTGVSDLHIWGICSHICSLSSHVVINDDYVAHDRQEEIIKRLNEMLKEKFNIEHTTIQLEHI